jgi:hypothetical protein
MCGMQLNEDLEPKHARGSALSAQANLVGGLYLHVLLL